MNHPIKVENKKRQDAAPSGGAAFLLIMTADSDPDMCRTSAEDFSTMMGMSTNTLITKLRTAADVIEGVDTSGDTRLLRAIRNTVGHIEVTDRAGQGQSYTVEEKILRDIILALRK